MKSILFVAIEFLPVNTAGIYRYLKLINYWNESDYDISVLTITETLCKKLYPKRIENHLVEKIPKGINLYRIIDEEVFHLFANKFFYNKYFKPKLLREKIDTIAEKISFNPDVIISCLPIFCSSFLAIELKNKFKSRLILDVRDDWSAAPFFIYKNYFFYLKRFLEEKYSINKADFFVTVTDPLLDRFRKRHKYLNEENSVCIPNSFDNELLIIKSKDKVKNKCIKIGYSGSFYYSPDRNQITSKSIFQRNIETIFQYFPVKEDWKYRSPYFFFLALEKLIKEHGINVQFHHIGRKPEWIDDMVIQFNLQNQIFFHGYCSKDQVLEIQKSWDYFLITSEKIINQDHYCIPSKIFDYLMYEKPIIGFVTNGPLKNMLRKLGHALIVNPDDIDILKLKVFLNSCFNYNRDETTENLSDYNSKNTAKAYLKLISKL